MKFYLTPDINGFLFLRVIIQRKKECKICLLALKAVCISSCLFYHVREHKQIKQEVSTHEVYRHNCDAGASIYFVTVHSLCCKFRAW